MKKKKMYRVVLISPHGLQQSVFIRANNRKAAENIALNENPNMRLDHSPFPQN